MNAYLLAAVLGLLIFSGIFLTGYALLRHSRLEERIRGGPAPDQRPRRSWRSYLRKSEHVIKPLGELVPRSPAEMSRQERRLVKAGIRRKDGPILFNGVKVCAAILAGLVFTSLRLTEDNPLLYISLSALIGAALPDLWLNYAIDARNRRIQDALPNALDLAVVCVEAGIGMDQALARIGREMEKGFPDLSEEFHLLGIEVNAGRTRADALRNMANRTGNQDLKSLVATLIQTDRFGTSVAQSLRVYSDSLRTTQRLRAEEHAAKMGIKMLPVLVFFIFPALFIVILGPAVISMIRDFLPAIGGK